MKWLNDFFGDRFHKRVFLVCLATSVLLLIASFLLPPMGLIEPSVLAGVGELFAFATLAQVVSAIERGKKATISKGDIHLTVGDEKNEKKDD